MRLMLLVVRCLLIFRLICLSKQIRLYRYSWVRADTDFDYRTDDFLEIYYNSDSDKDNNNDSNEQTNCFSSSVCYTEMRANLIFERLCLSCQNTFLNIFYKKVTYYFKLFFLILVKRMPNAIKV